MRDDLIKEYIVELATHATIRCLLGVSLRGSLACSRRPGLCRLQGRDYVIPDDVKALLDATFSHRLIISPSARIKNVEAQVVVEQVAGSVPVPGTRVKAREQR
jgi:MoxR-like ATPase